MTADRGGRLAPLLLLAALALACSGGGERAAVPAGTPVVLVSVDTLRSDRLPAYGYDRIETPAFDELRRDSILFLRAWAPVPLTLPSHVTALTGLLPPEHGVRDNMGYRFEAGRHPYLPELLRRHGYASGAAVSTFVLRGTSGLADGFDFYDDRISFVEWNDLGSVQRPGGETLQVALDWLRSVAARPFFLFFHIYEPHTPHEPPEPFARRYSSPYDGEVAYADQIVGDLVTELRRMGLYDRSIVVLTSDHGEGLGEHGYYEHGPLLYREALQVPLMLKLPASARGGETIERSVQLADLAPTVLDLLGIERPAELTGTSLLAPDAEAPERQIYGETFYPRLHFGWSDLASLIDYPWHFIDGPDPELYRLDEDPAEERNLVREKRRQAARLKRGLEAYDRTLEAPTETDPETRRKLAALGYVGSAPVEAEGPLPDPKSRLPVLALLKQAVEETAAGDLGAAAATYRRLLDEEPRMVDAWEKLAVILAKLDRQEEALAAIDRAMRLSGGAPHVALSAAGALLRLGRLDEAETHGEIALPAHELARDTLAQIALKKGDLARAEELAVRAVELRGTRLSPLVTLAELRLRQERFGEALELTAQAEREFGDRQDRDKLRGLYFIRGQAYARLGEAGPAAEAFLQEIEISPGELAPYTHLAFLYALEGKAREAGAALRRMVETNPRPRAYAEAVRTLRAMNDPRSAAALLRNALSRWPESPELRGLLPG